MRDFVELANGIDKNLSERERRIKMCDLLLEELGTLKGRDLHHYLVDFAFDLVVPGIKIVLKFPVKAHVFNPLCCDGKDNGLEEKLEIKSK